MGNIDREEKMLIHHLITSVFVVLTMVSNQAMTIYGQIPEKEPLVYNEQGSENEETSSDYITEEMSYGDAGRLIIEDVGISVRLYLANTDDIYRNQNITDMEDSACLYDFRSYGELSLGIGDHRNQGFDGLYDVVPGTIAKIYHEDGSVTTLRCVKIDRNSTNDQAYIYDSQGRKICMIDSELLYMYTCNPEGWWSVTSTLWEYC